MCKCHFSTPFSKAVLTLQQGGRIVEFDSSNWQGELSKNTMRFWAEGSGWKEPENDRYDLTLRPLTECAHRDIKFPWEGDNSLIYLGGDMLFTDKNGDTYELKIEHAMGHAVGDNIMWTIITKKGELPKMLTSKN